MFLKNRKHKLYFFLLLLSVAGYLLLGRYYYAVSTDKHEETAFCVMKNITGIPCPSCGTTRSVFHILNGDWWASAMINPLGFIVLLLLIIVPGWILIDLFSGRKGFYAFYNRTETLLKSNKWVMVPLALLISINWIWNIYKGL